MINVQKNSVYFYLHQPYAAVDPFLLCCFFGFGSGLVGILANVDYCFENKRQSVFSLVNKVEIALWK